MDLNTVLKDEHGKELTGPDKEPFSLRKALQAALIETPIALHPLSAADRLARYEIWKKISIPNGNEIEFSAEETEFLKAAAAALYDTPLGYGQIVDLLNGAVASPA